MTSSIGTPLPIQNCTKQKSFPSRFISVAVRGASGKEEAMAGWSDVRHETE